MRMNDCCRSGDASKKCKIAEGQWSRYLFYSSRRRHTIFDCDWSSDVCSSDLHERVFGVKPAGLWPSEGSVSDETLRIAAEEGFKWFGTDEGVLGHTLNIGFFRDGSEIGRASCRERV